MAWTQGKPDREKSTNSRPRCNRFCQAIQTKKASLSSCQHRTNCTMPPTACPRCQRVNPSEARFCHHDGAELRADGKARAADRMPSVFEFASGRRCHTYDELLDGCMEEWEQARDLLRQGLFRKFLEGIGRLNLARAAQEAESVADADVGLNQFLKKLPARAAHAPKLDFHPRRLALGSLRVGETRAELITIGNRGRGLLLGTLSVTEGNDWLSLAHER